MALSPGIIDAKLQPPAAASIKPPGKHGRTLQQIAVEDIGAFAAAVIGRREDVFGRRFDIAGDDLTGYESAAILSEAAGRDIHYEGFSPEV